MEHQLGPNLKPLLTCLCCNQMGLIPYVDLGEQPPPNAFYKLGTLVRKYEFQVQVCPKCHHSQVVKAVRPDILFHDYKYRTGVSATLREHYAKLAQNSLEVFKNLYRYQPSSVLDIGCNDGTLLNAFRRQGVLSTTGVDPSPIPEMQESEHHFLQGYWTPEFYDQCCSNVVKYNIITATNVLAHNDQPKEFLIACRQALHPEGLVILEFPYAKAVLEQCQFDTMYHEHISYFLARPLAFLLENTGLVVYHAELHDVHGGSLRLFLRLAQNKADNLNDVTFNQLIYKEEVAGLHNDKMYLGFQNRIKQRLNKLIEVLNNRDFNGQQLFVFGASAKATVLTNCLKSHDCMPFLEAYDETPYKIGLKIPGVSLDIVHPKKIEDRIGSSSFLVMSWNCYEESLLKIRNHLSKRIGLNKCKYCAIRHVPEVAVELITF